MNLYPQLTALIDRYDVFFVDQFGTLHDGSAPYPGATEAISALRTAGKTVVILSNSGKSGAENAARFIRMGFAPDSFDHFVTSGDVAVESLRTGALGFPFDPATRCFTVSSGNDRNLVQRLGYRTAEHAEDADLVVIAGSDADRIGLDAYQALLSPAAEADVPAICTNPDIEMLTPTGLAPAAGRIAELYKAMGGRVHWIGKPHPAIYDYAHRLCGHPDKKRILAIGDSIEHDVAGAAGFGIDAVLVRNGVSGGAGSETLLAKIKEARLDVRAIVDALA